MLSQEDFCDRAKDFTLLKDVEGKYFTFDAIVVPAPPAPAPTAASLATAMSTNLTTQIKAANVTSDDAISFKVYSYIRECI